MMMAKRPNFRTDADLKENIKRAAIREAVLEADKGIFISQDKMDAWVSSWGTDSEYPLPEPDIFPDPK